ncbi:hypothetical protein TNCV_5040821 [Trichonephila clavipes]|nr:hypothetical protein TNCV_5040821 [Trichonephila clavipes]
MQIEGESSDNKTSAYNAALEWYKQQSEYCPTQLLLLKRIRDLAAKKRRCTMPKKSGGYVPCSPRHLKFIKNFRLDTHKAEDIRRIRKRSHPQKISVALDKNIFTTAM